MKTISMVKVAALAVSLLLAGGEGALATAPRFGPKLIKPEEALKVVAYHYPPLVDSRAPGLGMAAALVQGALLEGNLPAELEIVPVKSLARRALLYDGAPALLAPPSLFSRGELAKLSVLPVCSVRQRYYFYEPAHRELLSFRGGEQGLKGYRLGIAKGETPPAGSWLAVTGDEPRSLLRRLKEKELDLVLLPEQVARHLVKRHHGEEVGSFRALPVGAPDLPLSLIVNPRDRQGGRIREGYLRGMERLKRNGKYAEIVERHQGEGGQANETYRAAAPQGVIEFGSSETPPFYAPQLPRDGMAGEIVHALFEEIGLKSVIRYFPLKRLYTDHQNNHLGDPENFAGQQFSAIVPIALYRPAFFYYRPRHPKGVRYRSPEDLKGYRIGVLRGTLENREYFERYAISVTELDNEQSLFRQLREGRIDLCGVIRETGEFTARTLYPADARSFVPLEIPHAVGAIAIMISADHPDGKRVGERLGEALSRLVKNGTYLRIVERYYPGAKPPADWLPELERFRVRYREQDAGKGAP